MKLCNLNYLKSVSPRSNTFAIDMISLFLKDTPEAINLIKTALENDKYFDIYKNGIKIKPSFQMLGLNPELFDKLNEVLRLANTMNEKDKIKELIKDIEKGLNSVYIELEKELNELKN
jgi:hypothetical protein